MQLQLVLFLFLLLPDFRFLPSSFNLARGVESMLGSLAVGPNLSVLLSLYRLLSSRSMARPAWSRSLYAGSLAVLGCWLGELGPLPYAL
jgi:hypothetical protein